MHAKVKKGIKITAWSILGVFLFISGLLMGVVGILTPERLTPLLERVATNSLQNARVEIGRAELTVVKTFPFVHAQVDNLVVLSTIKDAIDADYADELDIPAYADTVLTVQGFEGGLNIIKLFKSELDLTDVTITRPAANLVVIDDEYTNFDIIPPSTDNEPFTWDDVPGITIRRFAIVDPGTVRYTDLQTGTDIGVNLSQVDLTGTGAPLYTLNFDGRIDAPSELLEAFNIPDLKFGLNGDFYWDRKDPSVIRLENFDFLFSIFGGRLNTTLDFTDGLKARDMDLKLNPLDVSQLLSMVPEDMAEELGIPTPEQLATDAALNLSLRFDSPWDFGGNTIPPLTLTATVPPCFIDGLDIDTKGFAPTLTVNVDTPLDIENLTGTLSLSLNIPPCPVTWKDVKLNTLAVDATATVTDMDPQTAVIDIRCLELKGPATDISLKGTLTDPMGKCEFNGSMDGTTNLGRLPSSLKNLIDGTLTGTLTAHVGFRGSPHMFNATDFHRLAMNGNLTLRNLYWLSGDTVNMFKVDRVAFNFGTDRTLGHGKEKADSLLAVAITVDSAYIIHSDLVMGVRNFRLSLATDNRARSARRDMVKGMGGALSLDAFNLTKMSDSALVRVRGVKGLATVRPHNGNVRIPEFGFNLDVNRISTGDRTTRVVIRNAHTDITAWRVAKGKSAKRFSAIADSIYLVHPELPPDSVLARALAIHNRHRSAYPRVHPLYEAKDSLEIMDWGASPLFKKILNLWTFHGSLTSDRASLFSPYMPMRNRFRHINLAFNNDTVAVNNVQYKVGRSDFVLDGVVTNMRRAFTGVSGRSPLRVNLGLVSDTIDVNQLTDLVMAGAAFGASRASKEHFSMGNIDQDEDELERKLAARTQDAPDTVMPLLIPVNLDAEFSLKAGHVLYSDLVLDDMQGRVLAYNGSLNLDNLGARSSVGNINLSALYSGRNPQDLRFGFGLQLDKFNIDKFLKLVPAVDSVLPVMRDFAGTINADVAATADVDSHMNLVMPTLDAAIGIKGDSLALLDPDTFSSLAKWLMFKDKKRNFIDHMDVQMTIRDNQLDIYPFIFTIDRYRLGVQGYNDFNMNFHYHIAVLKSPIPFKFGINISGNPDKYKIRLGGAKFGEKQIRQVAIVDTTRVNLLKEIKDIFRRGSRDARLARLKVDTKPLAVDINLATDTLTAADSILYIQQGLIDAPVIPEHKNGKHNKRKNNK